MKTLLPQIIGLLAVAALLLCYQQKKRGRIILFNLISRCLYILQYIMLGAFSGAVLDVLGAVAAAVAGKKTEGFVKKHAKLIEGILITAIAAVGLAIAFVNRSFLDLFSLAGVLLQIIALWLTKEKHIRALSLIAVPFWLTYNFLSRAYGSSVGDILSGCSIIIAMVRYRNEKDS